MSTEKSALFFLNRKGGGSHFTYEICREIAVNSKETQIFLPYNNQQRELFEKLGLKITFLPHYSSYVTFFLFFSCALPFNAIYILFYLKRNNIKKVICTMPSLYFPFIALFFKLIGVRYHLIIHDAEQHLGEKSFFQSLAFKLDLCLADKFFVLSRHVGEQLQDLTNKEVVLIKHGALSFGVDGLDGAPKFFLKQKKRKILYVGRIKEYKGVRYFLEANEISSDRDDVEFICAGSGGIDGLDDAELKMKYPGTNIILEWLSDRDVVQLISECDVVVLPYIEASQSGVIPLALNYGKPLIVTKVGGLKEQVNDDFAITISPGSVSDIVNAYEMIADDSLLMDMSRAAKFYSKESVGWGEIVKRLI
jgi:glycosyltransferase involved in cell wall biosynthesis